MWQLVSRIKNLWNSSRFYEIIFKQRIKKIFKRKINQNNQQIKINKKGKGNKILLISYQNNQFLKLKKKKLL